MSNWKRIVGFKLRNLPFYNILILGNQILYHWDLRMHKEKRGNDYHDKYFYIIRPRGYDEGILSIYDYVIQECQMAREKGWVPVVDFQDSETQYKINGRNSWQMFFEQPEGYSLSDVQHAEHLIFNGWTVNSIMWSKKQCIYQNKSDIISPSSYVLKQVSKVEKELDLKHCLGILIRGTDYDALKPSGHHIQPSGAMMLNEVAKCIENNPSIDSVFLVTEDNKKAKILIDGIDSSFPNIEINYIANSIGGGETGQIDYLAEQYKSADPAVLIDNTILYVAKIIVLSKCHYLVASITSAKTLIDNYESVDGKVRKYIDLGIYK